MTDDVLNPADADIEVEDEERSSCMSAGFVVEVYSPGSRRMDVATSGDDSVEPTVRIVSIFTFVHCQRNARVILEKPSRHWPATQTTEVLDSATEHIC